MTRYILAALVLTLPAASAFAHHPAADHVDADIYERIDEQVSQTPHGDMTFDDMGARTTTVTVSLDSAEDLEDLVAEGLLEDVQDLTGDVRASLTFEENGAVTLDIVQRR